jgi:ApaG protein
MSDTITEGVRVLVSPRYVPEQSDPDEGRYLFAYQVRIENQSQRSVQLIDRHWIITDGFGKVEEVRGSGVVGHQPLLKPGQVFDYTSVCPLATPVGTMHGGYGMLDVDNGQRFNAEIRAFRLAIPGILN